MPRSGTFGVWFVVAAASLVAAAACSSTNERFYMPTSDASAGAVDAPHRHDGASAPDGPRTSDAHVRADATTPIEAARPDDAADDAPVDAASAEDSGADAHSHHHPDAGRDAKADAPEDAGDPLGLACSGASPSFMTDVTPILNNCSGGELCHGGGISPFDSGPRMPWPYTSLVNVMATRDTCHLAGLLVKPGSLDESYLAHKLTGVDICPGTGRMPLHGAKLPDAEIQTIADWICKGARNN